MYVILTLQDFLQGDASKAAKELGWKPKITFKVSLTAKLPQITGLSPITTFHTSKELVPICLLPFHLLPFYPLPFRPLPFHPLPFRPLLFRLL